MSRQARPKRAADVYARTHDQGEDGDAPSAKKPRFDYRNPSTLAPDAPEDDAVLDLDEIGKAGGTKRNAVNIDGYDSDSDNDNFDARARAKAKAQEKSQQEDENDMFADLEEADGDDDEELQREGKKSKKDVKFLDVDDIEGQVHSSKSGGHVSADFSYSGKSKPTRDDADSSSESGDDEERDRVASDADEDELEIGAGGKKHHAPKLDAFNMRNENEEGKFDESGNFVRKAMDPDAVHDMWMEGVSRKEMKKAKEAQELREQERRQKDREDDALLTSDLLGNLIRHLEVGENALEALQRLGRGKPKSKPKTKYHKNKQNGHADSGAMEVDAVEDPAETKRKEAVEAITGAADQLMTRGDLEVYDHERELLTRMYKRETGEDWRDEAVPGANGDVPSEDKQWEYQWADGRDGGQIHGPYDGATMKAWNEAGYFGEGVEFRAAGTDDWQASAAF